MKKKIAVMLSLVLCLLLCISLAACGYNKLTSGNVVANGNFAEGVTLLANKLKATDDNYTAAITKIADKDYDKEKVAVYDISLVKDDAKVQPNGKVKITMPAPFESETGYVTYHISGDKVEELATALAYGKISFETTSFSYFVVTAKAVESKFTFLAQASPYDGGKITENGQEADFGNGRQVEQGTQITLTAIANEGYTFKGWYKSNTAAEELFSSEATCTFTVENEDMYIAAVFETKVTALLLDAANAGFTYNENGTLAAKTVVEIGDADKPRPEDVLVYGVKADKEVYLTKDVDYTIDLGGLDFTKKGTYTITYTYKADTSIKATLTVEVVEGVEATITFSNTQNADSLGHLYNGAAVFVSKKDIIIDGTPLSEITDEGILDKISYVWRDKNTQEVVSPDGDITLTGEVRTNYGVNGNITIGYEIAGPCVVGEYEFVLSYNGVEKLVVEATITESSFQKITSVEDFDTTTAPTIFGAICYYTIVGYVNGQMYVMQMPADGSTATSDIVEAQARLVAAQEDGSLVLGGKHDFVFTPMRYFVNEWKYYPEGSTDRENLLVDFCTGYYGARTATINLATQVINRTGWTSLSGNKIVRNKGEFRNSDPYGYLTKFSADDGSVKIYAPRKGETENNALRLVKNTDGSFAFTGKDSTTDTRESFPIYVYKFYVKQVDTFEFYAKLDKEYDGNAVQFNAYKDFYMKTESGENLGSMLKMGTVRFVFKDLKDNVVMVGNVQEDGTVTGPSEVGQYKLVIQFKEKGADGAEWVDKAVLNEFEIYNASSD